jgi:hypothetical protein
MEQESNLYYSIAMSTIRLNLLMVVRVRVRWVCYAKRNKEMQSIMVNTYLTMVGNRVHYIPSAGTAAVH